jgi:hypothetical protein
VTISPGLDEMAEAVKTNLGVSRTRLYELALTDFLRNLGVLSAAAKTGKREAASN